MKKVLRIFLTVLAVLITITIFLVGPVNNTPIEQRGFYRQMMASLDTITAEEHLTDSTFEVAWGETNITPPPPFPMAGYAPRSTYTNVHDSLFIKVLALKQGDFTIFFISADLLIFPPSLRDRLEELMQIPTPYFLYLGATHTHSGVGGWNNSLVGKITMGKYHPAWVEATSQQLVELLHDVINDLQPAKLKYFEKDAAEFVENRLAGNYGTTDGWLRGFEIFRRDSTSAFFSTYSAHATNINHKSTSICADYPAEISKVLKEQYNVDFSLFMAGMVGSHRLTGIDGLDYEKTEKAGEVLAAKIYTSEKKQVFSNAKISTVQAPILHGGAQLQFEPNLRLRNWVFESVAGPLKGDIKAVSIGDMVLVGLPCDFSGEIYTEFGLQQYADSLQKNLIITSFNGDYTGYIVFDKHFGKFRNDEVLALNWVGPGYDQYYIDMIKQFLAKMQ